MAMPTLSPTATAWRNVLPISVRIVHTACAAPNKAVPGQNRPRSDVRPSREGDQRTATVACRPAWGRSQRRDAYVPSTLVPTTPHCGQALPARWVVGVEVVSAFIDR